MVTWLSTTKTLQALGSRLISSFSSESGGTSSQSGAQTNATSISNATTIITPASTSLDNTGGTTINISASFTTVGTTSRILAAQNSTLYTIFSATEQVYTSSVVTGVTTGITGSTSSITSSTNAVGGSASGLTTITTETTNSTQNAAYTYTIQSTETTTFTRTASTTATINSTYRITSASSISTTSGETSITVSSITTFTTNVSQSSLRSIGITFTDTRKIPLLLSTNSRDTPFAYVTAVEATYNELIGAVNHTKSGPDIITNNFSTFTGISTFAQSSITSPVVTFALPTRTVVWDVGNGTSTTTSAVDKSTFSIDSISSTETELFSFSSTETVTEAISSFVTPYTRTSTFARLTGVSVSTTTTRTTASGVDFAVGNSFLTTHTTFRKTTYNSMVAKDNFSFIYSVTEVHGRTSTLVSTRNTVVNFVGDTNTTSYVLTVWAHPFNIPPWVHTGFSTSSTFTSSFTQVVTSNSISFTTSYSETFSAEADYETVETINANIVSVGHGLAGVVAPLMLWYRSFDDTAFIPPNQNFSTNTPGTNLGPSLPTAYIIPASYGGRDDGPVTPLPLNGSTILTFLRNTTGGFGTSVNSNSYTTFSWSYSNDSLSITTKTTYTAANGANIDTSTSSSSTSVILDKIGNATTIFTSISKNLDSATNQCLALGGQQKYSDVTYHNIPSYIIGTTYSINGNSNTYSSLLFSIDTISLSSNTNYSVEQYVVYFYNVSGNYTGQLTIFSRNLTSAV